MRDAMGTHVRTSVVSAWLTAFGAERTQARVTLTELSPPARLRRSVGGLLGFWGAAMVAVFFPVIHLILVPTLLVSGVVVAVLLGRQSRKVASVHGICPRCRTEQEFVASGRVQHEQMVDCPGCHANVTLILENALDAEAPRSGSVGPAVSR
jgi:hypothetical protein